MTECESDVSDKNDTRIYLCYTRLEYSALHYQQWSVMVLWRV